MRENFIRYFICNLLLLIFGIVTVDAATLTTSDVTLRSDLITATNTVNGYFDIGRSESFNSSEQFTSSTYGGTLSRTSGRVTGLVSVKNGTYYVWHVSAVDGNASNFIRVQVSNSCDNQVKTNQTGTFTLERCFYKTKSGEVISDGVVNVTCKSGYTFTQSKLTTDTCANLDMKGLSKRYCKKVWTFTCSKGGTSNPPIAAATLSKLSLSGASISPTFKASTKKYSATVESNVSSIKVNATASSGNTLVKGYGSRTVKLAYGKNTIKVKVKNSAGSTVTYYIYVTRKDNRSSVNTLSNLTIDVGTLSPAFSSSRTDYSVSVSNDVSSMKINATLTDNKSKFVSGYGPRSVALKEGLNQIKIKVKSQKGATKTYTINVTRGKVPSACQTQTGELALLKGIEIQANEFTQITLEDFDPLKKDYEGITVPYEIKNLTVLPLVRDEGDTYTVDGTNDLEVNIPREIKIVVTSKACPTFTSIYTINVTRLAENEGNQVADLKSLTIKNHKEFKFEKNKMKYNLTLKKGETELVLDYKTESETTKCAVLGNEELAYGSIITIECTAENGEDTALYTITIDGVEKGTNTFLIILVIIIIIIVLILIIMRMLGYKIYFNMEALKAAFRGMGEKAKNTFDK